MIKIFRLAAWLHRHRIPLLPRLLYGLNRVVFAVVLPPSVVVGKNVLFAYSGLGTVIHARARIGNDVKISQNVTIGGRSGLHDVPVIEDGAEIGTGACVLGPIVIGRNARVGAGAVVLHDIPEGAVATGVPAVVRQKTSGSS
ncbi:serine O-acetyltransferase [Pseudoduganella lutea]|uniref:Serine acetyltransferase n=1 Tax=Pseudoduganella lutea TaxID=321985 RepID=A0A4P6KUA6_9BURK|nr:serine acetyltransferase [Pseudoduganella lutea]QBE62510.1 serine acetyltransferase [Pseudoduganella lutea]